MPQNYKVFFNERLLLITHPNEAPEGICKEVITELNPNHIAKEIKDFKLSQVINYCLCYHDPEKLFKVVLRYFHLMEAAGGVVCHPDGKFLFIKRFGKWDLPKGKIEIGESPENAALREVAEECGILDLSIISSLPITYHTYTMDGQDVMKITWWYGMSSSQSINNLTPQTEEGITEAIWLIPAQIDMVLANTYRSLSTLINDINWNSF